MPQRLLIAGHLIIEAVSLLGIGVSGFAALAMSSPEVDTDKLGHGSGQYVLAVWVLFMIAATYLIGIGRARVACYALVLFITQLVTGCANWLNWPG